MGSLQHSFDRNVGRRLVFKYPKGLERPVDLSRGHIPAKAACLAQSLRFSQVSFTSSQRLLCAVAFGSLPRFAQRARDRRHEPVQARL